MAHETRLLCAADCLFSALYRASLAAFMRPAPPSAANLNIHLHALVVDGVYGNLDAVDTAGRTDERSPASAPTFHLAGQGHDLDAQDQHC